MAKPAAKKQKLSDVDAVAICDPSKCDVTFRVQHRDIPYVKALLEHQSPVFATMFSANWAEGNNPQKSIKLKQKKYDDIFTLFKVLTPGGDRFVTRGNFERLLELSDEYELKSVASACEKFLLKAIHAATYSAKDYVKYLTIACKYGLNDALRILCKPWARRYADVQHAEQLLTAAKAHEPHFRRIRDSIQQKLVNEWSAGPLRFKKHTLAEIITIADKFDLMHLIDVLLPKAARLLSAAELRQLRPKISSPLFRALVTTRRLYRVKKDATFLECKRDHLSAKKNGHEPGRWLNLTLREAYESSDDESSDYDCDDDDDDDT